jgi:hypothetical protein
MIPAHNFYGLKLKCYGLKFLFAKINLDSITFSKISPFLMAHEWKICTPQQRCDWRHHLPRDCHVICHVDKPECDTWTIQSSTRGQTAARHVALCQKATSSYPCEHVPCHVSSQHGPCHVASLSVTNFVTIWLGHRRNTLLWQKTCWSWKSSTSMTKMTDWSW